MSIPLLNGSIFLAMFFWMEQCSKHSTAKWNHILSSFPGKNNIPNIPLLNGTIFPAMFSQMEQYSEHSTIFREGISLMEPYSERKTILALISYSNVCDHIPSRVLLDGRFLTKFALLEPYSKQWETHEWNLIHSKVSKVLQDETNPWQRYPGWNTILSVILLRT